MARTGTRIGVKGAGFARDMWGAKIRIQPGPRDKARDKARDKLRGGLALRVILFKKMLGRVPWSRVPWSRVPWPAKIRSGGPPSVTRAAVLTPVYLVDLSRLLALFAAFFVLSTVAGQAVVRASDYLHLKDSASVWAAQVWFPLGVYLIFTAAMVVAARQRGGLRKLWSTPSGVVKEVTVGVIAGIGLFVLGNALYWALSGLIPNEKVTGPLRGALSSVASAGGLGPFAFLVIVAAPAVEEIFFRGLIYGALRRRLSQLASIALSAGIFALSHLQPFWLPGVFAVGLVLGAVYERRRSLVAPVVAHGLFNAINFLVASVSLQAWGRYT